MYKLIIYHDDGKVEVAAQGTKADVNAAIPAVLNTINPDTALWQLKWDPTPVSIESVAAFVNSQMGHVDGN